MASISVLSQIKIFMLVPPDDWVFWLKNGLHSQ